MSIEQAVVEKLRTLPPDKQQEVLDFVEFLQQKNIAKHPHCNPKGLWVNMGIQITEKDISDVRQEMWGNFPREDF